MQVFDHGKRGGQIIVAGTGARVVRPHLADGLSMLSKFVQSMYILSGDSHMWPRGIGFWLA